MSVIKFVLSVLKRKEVSDKEARQNFEEVIWDYINNIQSTDDLEIDSTKNSYQHKTYYEKLKILAERYKHIGNEVISDDKVEDFLNDLQNRMRDYLYDDVESELYQLRKKHYTKSAFNKPNPHDSPAFQKAKAEMFKTLTDYSELG